MGTPTLLPCQIQEVHRVLSHIPRLPSALASPLLQQRSMAVARQQPCITTHIRVAADQGPGRRPVAKASAQQ